MTNQNWKDQLDRDGFVHIPQALAPVDVEILAALSLQSVDDFSASEDLIKTPYGVPLKLTYPLDKYPEFLSVLGCKAIRDIVDQLLPKLESVLTWEDVLIKMPLVGGEVGAHQDIGLDPVRHTVHSLGISLHSDGDNPVSFLPGSHRLGPMTADAVSAIQRDCREQFLPVKTEPGDVVIHNVHVLHYSEPNSSERPRATWYLEFRSLTSLLERGPWSRDWAYRRRAIWVYARQAGGDDIGDGECDEVNESLSRLLSGQSSLRVPHVTENVRYDPTSPFHHFSSWTDDWKTSKVASEGSHHLNSADRRSLYPIRFDRVEKFHAPGLAPVADKTGAYHITPDGLPAYEPRYLRTFGFYEGRAAVHSEGGWFHIGADGGALYPERYDWCGNFQEGRCPVRLPDNRYLHIREDGVAAYAERYRYAGDFKDSLAVVQRDDGRHSHVDQDGALLHGRWFLDLDVFHKSYARARDEAGWHHVDRLGMPLYNSRFRNVEPFYNGQARVEGFNGALSVISEAGDVMLELRQPLQSPLEELSSDLVGMWRTQTIRAAVDAGVFEALPASAYDIEKSLPLAESVGTRLVRALTELDLVQRDQDGVYHPTNKGSLLQRAHPLSLADAVSLWGGDSYTAWSEAAYSLRTGESAYTKLFGKNFFDHIGEDPGQLAVCRDAYAAYAKHDYQTLSASYDFGRHGHILDAGGGSGELAFALLRAYPGLTATVMDRPEVIGSLQPPDEVRDRCHFAPGDFFEEWPVKSDAVILARVLHDWPDADAFAFSCVPERPCPRAERCTLWRWCKTSTPALEGCWT